MKILHAYCGGLLIAGLLMCGTTTLAEYNLHHFKVNFINNSQIENLSWCARMSDAMTPFAYVYPGKPVSQTFTFSESDIPESLCLTPTYNLPAKSCPEEINVKLTKLKDDQGNWRLGSFVPDSGRVSSADGKTNVAFQVGFDRETHEIDFTLSPIN